MNALVIRLDRARLQSLLDDPDAGLVIQEFEGKADVDSVVIFLRDESPSSL